MDVIISKLREELKCATLESKSENLALSGGLDSSIIGYLYKEKNPNAVAIIAEDFVASDLAYCQIVAKQFDIPLNIQSTKTERILEAIEETIRILGNFNDIEIRNSIVMYLAIDYIKKSGSNSLITGDGADELFAGYSFFFGKNQNEIDSERKRIADVMHFPSHKIGESLGVKVESPFLADSVIEMAKSIESKYLVREENGKMYGKWILRKAFEDDISKKIAWRQKAAMQDGAGTSGLVQMFNSVMQDDEFEAQKEEIAKTDEVILRSKESMHYYKTYCKIFGTPKRDGSCPYCKGTTGNNPKFCKMCGAYPL